MPNSTATERRVLDMPKSLYAFRSLRQLPDRSLNGLFAGMSLNGSSLSPDSDANERYGKPLSAREIVVGNVAKPTPGGQRLVSLLNTQISKHAK
jgi:hypothetical protein